MGESWRQKEGMYKHMLGDLSSPASFSFTKVQMGEANRRQQFPFRGPLQPPPHVNNWIFAKHLINRRDTYFCFFKNTGHPEGGLNLLVIQNLIMCHYDEFA